MNKRLLKYFWALPLLGMLSGCSESAVNEGSQNSKYAVQFEATATKQATKAAAVDKDLVKTKPFGLFAYHGTDWSTILNGGTGPANTPNFMNNTEVSYSTSNGGWEYSPLAFWTDDKISFFGYWPEEAGVTSATATAGNMPQVEFTQNMDAANMVDFVTSYAVDKDKNTGKVTLDFHHVLTRLNFKARADRDLQNSGTNIYITDLKVLGKTANASSKLYSKGTFVLGDGLTDGDGHWSLNTNDIQDGDLEVGGILDKKAIPTTNIIDEDNGNQPYTDVTTQAVTVAQDGSETPLLGNGQVTFADNTQGTRPHYLFLLPPYGKNGIQDNDIMVELSYDVVSANPTLDNKGTVSHWTKRVSLKAGTLIQGKPYNVIFTVGLNVVELDVDVTDWDTDEIAYAPSVDAAGNTATNIIDAWKNLNSIKKAEKDGGNDGANYSVIKVAKMPTATEMPNGYLDLRSTVTASSDLNEFDLGDQVELLFDDDTDGTKFTSTVLVPDGWVYSTRTVNGVERHIIAKIADYITTETNTAGNSSIIKALQDLNTQKASNPTKHYYAVDVNATAPDAGDLTLTSLTTADLSNFGDDDNLYIIFTSDGGADKGYSLAGATGLTGWEIVKETNEKTLGKYRLQKIATKASSIAIGQTGYVAGSTINVNK